MKTILKITLVVLIALGVTLPVEATAVAKGHKKQTASAQRSNNYTSKAVATLHQFNTNLSPGYKGEAVVDFQKFLQKLEYYKGEITGHYNSQTISAAKRFQRDYGLKVDGLIWKNSRKVANDLNKKDQEALSAQTRTASTHRFPANQTTRNPAQTKRAIPVKLQPVTNVRSGAAPSVKKTFRFSNLQGLKPVFARKLLPSFYWEPMQSRFGGLLRKEMKSRSGVVLAKVSAKDKKNAEMEGSLRLKNGEVLNIGGYKSVGRKGKRHLESYWVLSPYTRGAYTNRLIPFRHVAMDKKRVPPNSIIQIEELIGIPLPDGTIHDGYCRNVDCGKMIKGFRIDIFVGPEKYKHYLEKFGIQHLRTLHANIIPPIRISRLANR